MACPPPGPSSPCSVRPHVGTGAQRGRRPRGTALTLSSQKKETAAFQLKNGGEAGPLPHGCSPGAPGQGAGPSSWAEPSASKLATELGASLGGQHANPSGSGKQNMLPLVSAKAIFTARHPHPSKAGNISALLGCCPPAWGEAHPTQRRASQTYEVGLDTRGQGGRSDPGRHGCSHQTSGASRSGTRLPQRLPTALRSLQGEGVAPRVLTCKYRCRWCRRASINGVRVDPLAQWSVTPQALRVLPAPKAGGAPTEQTQLSLLPSPVSVWTSALLQHLLPVTWDTASLCPTGSVQGWPPNGGTGPPSRAAGSVKACKPQAHVSLSTELPTPLMALWRAQQPGRNSPPH